MGRAGKIKSHAKPLLLWIQVWQDRTGGGETNGLGIETTEIILVAMIIIAVLLNIITLALLYVGRKITKR